LSGGNISQLFQLLVLLTGLDEHRQILICVFPKCKEILIRLAGAGRVAIYDCGSREAELRKRACRRKRIYTRIVNDLFEFCDGFVAPALLKITISTQ
jgi:hypothetical protein